VSEAVLSAKLVWEMSGRETVADLRAALQGETVGGEHPEEWWALAERAGYRADVGWAGGGDEGRYHVLLRQGDDPETITVPAMTFPQQTVPPPLWWQYANNPLQSRFLQQLAPRLREYLDERLPEYMVPSNFVLLDSMPLNANGKINRRLLPAPDTARPEMHAEFVAPRTPVEETLTTLWSEILGMDQVGVHDDFFDLGGHSLLGTQLVSRIREIFHVEMPLQRLFETPTIAGLAESIETLTWAASQASDEVVEDGEFEEGQL